MSGTRFYEDVEVAAELPSLEKHPTYVSLFLYDVAIWASHRIHYDQDHARSEGLRDVVIVGPMQTAYIGQMLVNWAGGDPSCMKKISVSHRAMAHPGDTLTAKAVARRKHAEGDTNCVEFDVWVENQDGVHTTIGSATLALPSRG